MPSNSIFLGVTTAPARDYVAQTLIEKRRKLFHMPCAGRFAVVEALIKHGAKPGSINCSDIGLFSSIIGYLADPHKKFDDLQIVLPEGTPLDGVSTELDIAATAMLLLKLSQIGVKSQFAINQRNEITSSWALYREQIKGKLQTLVSNVRGINYDIADVWAVIEQAKDDRDSALFVNVPTYKGGYTKMFSGADVTWNEPEIPEYNPESFPMMLELLTGVNCASLVYVQKDLKAVPEGWQTVFAQPYTVERTDYLISNVDAQPYVFQKVKDEPVTEFPIWNEEAITEDSQVQFVHVNTATALYYRDLFVHKLGVTQAETYLVMLVDGRITTSLGLNTQFLRRFQSEYIYEVFGISKSSHRYMRFGKLFMLCLTSGSMRQYLLREMKFGVREPSGIQTSSITTFEEGKTDRSVMRLVSRTKLPDGRFKVIYRADFRDDTWQDCVRNWLAKWGEKKRS